MIQMFTIFAIIAILVMIFITMFKGSSVNEKIVFFKFSLYALACSIVSISILVLIVFLF